MKKIFLFITLVAIVAGCSKDDPKDSNSCKAPSGLNANDITNTAVGFSWNVNSNSSLFQIEYGVVGFEHGTGTTLTVSDTYYKYVTDLSPQIQYSFYVKAYCDDSGSYSDWVGPKSFITLETNPYCEDPAYFQVDGYTDSIAYDHIDLTWGNADFDGVQIEYGIHGFSLGEGITKIVDETIYPSSTRIENLNPNTSYDFYIRNQCDIAGYSPWIGPITESTKPTPYNLNCVDPVNFTLDEIYTSSGQDHLVFSWDALNGETTWQLHQVRHGYAFDTGSTLDTSYNPIHLTNYTTSGIEYDFYIRSNCGMDGYSDWVGPITIVGP